MALRTVTFRNRAGRLRAITDGRQRQIPMPATAIAVPSTDQEFG